MSTNNQFPLGPSDILDFQFDWTDWLASGEIITSASIIPQFGLTVYHTSFDDNTVTTWISGSTGKFKLGCKVQTDSGAGGVYKTEERMIYLTVAER
jgi:hypothetical protein